jgi:hypothetical protein
MEHPASGGKEVRMTAFWRATAVAAVAWLASAAMSAQCSNASLKGTYGVITHGERLGIYDTATPPAIHLYSVPVRLDEITIETFDGAGNATQTESIHLGGINLISTPDGFVGGGVGTYQVKPDCTGVENLTFGGQQFKMGFVLTDGGKGFHRLWTSHHIPSLAAAALPAGVSCDAPAGCDASEQIFSDGRWTRGLNSAQVLWIQPGSLAGFGGATSLVVAGSAGGPAATGAAVTLYWQDATAGSSVMPIAYTPTPDSKGVWYNSIPNANFGHQYVVYAVYGDTTSASCTYAGNGQFNSCP